MSFTLQLDAPGPTEAEQPVPSDTIQPAADANELVFTPGMAPPPPPHGEPRVWPKAKLSASFQRPVEVVFQAAVQAVRGCKCDVVSVDRTNHHLQFSLDDANGVAPSVHDLFAFDTAGATEVDISSPAPNEHYRFDEFYQSIVREMGKYLMFVAEPQPAKDPPEPPPPRRRSIGLREDEFGYRRRSSRRRTNQLVSSLVVWSLVAGAFGVSAGLFLSQYLPVFGDWLSIHLAEPLSPARLHYVPIHCLVFGLIGAMGGAAVATIIHHTRGDRS